MLEEATAERKDEISRFSDLKSAILNSPYGPYLKQGDNYPYKSDHFIPKNLLKKAEKKQITTAERNRRLLEAGNAMMNAVDSFNMDIKKRR